MKPCDEDGRHAECGLALLISLAALALVSLIGLSLAINAGMDMKISDNFETMIRARNAALAGLNHARELSRGIEFDDFLKGPDGTFSLDPHYLAFAKSHRFRNPLEWPLASVLNIRDPAAQLVAVPDDGLVNTGPSIFAVGTALIPLLGVPQLSGSAAGSGSDVTSRYFVKVTDNNTEVSELRGDPDDRPYVDGDGIIIVRSMGLSQTLAETTGDGRRLNSVSVFEIRLKRRRSFDLPGAVVLQARDVLPSGPLLFDGGGFRIQGGAASPGIATLDLDLQDAVSPQERILSQIGAEQSDLIQGAGLVPSVVDATPGAALETEDRMLLDPGYLGDFIWNRISSYADTVLFGNQDWPATAPSDLGEYDPSIPANGPGQTPRITYVGGDLNVTGQVSGAGVLVVTGRLCVTGVLDFYGLILVTGSGDLDLEALGGAVRGGIFVANLPAPDGSAQGGIARITVGGQAEVTLDRAALALAARLMPPVQISFREVTLTMDP